MTQIQEFTLAFVPKLIGVGVALLVSRQLDAAHAHRLHPGPLRRCIPALLADRGAPMTITLAGEPLLAYLLASVRIVAWLALVPPFPARVGAGDRQGRAVARPRLRGRPGVVSRRQHPDRHAGAGRGDRADPGGDRRRRWASSPS